MKLGILMDPLNKLVPYKDSTLCMIKAAQAMGWFCAYFTLNDLSCRNGKPYANVSTIRVGDVTSADWAEIAPLGEWSLDQFDIILMRKDPPFDLEYIYATYALELAELEGVLISNKPNSLRAANEKFFTLRFPQCCPTTLVSRDIQQLRAFWEQHQNVVFKPLDGMGGENIFHVDEKGQNLSVILDVLTQKNQVSTMAQIYLPEIHTIGDKRIILIQGEPVPYALLRTPISNGERGNLAAGAIASIVDITDRDRFLCSQIAPTLQAMDLHFVGIDVIGDYITEINVTSPTCLTYLMEDTGLDIAGDYLRSLRGGLE